MPNRPAISEAPSSTPQDGPWLQHDKSGTLRERAVLQQRLLHGPLSLFDEHGRLTLEEHYVRGKVEGIRRIFVDGKLHTVAHYRSSLQHGETRLYHVANGALAATLPFHHGNLHGQACYFDQDGNLARTSFFQKGMLHGETRSFFPNGGILSTELYTFDLLDGESKWLSAQGDVIKRTLFVQGKPASPAPAPQPVTSTAPKRKLAIKPS